jgi:hypothetical protein
MLHKLFSIAKSGDLFINIQHKGSSPLHKGRFFNW